MSIHERYKKISEMINSDPIEIKDSAYNDYGKNSRYQCATILEPKIKGKYLCALIGKPEWVSIEDKPYNKIRKGYHIVYHGWCREKNKKYDDSREKTYRTPEKILEAVDCVIIEKYSPTWVYKKIKKDFAKRDDAFYKLKKPTRYIIKEPENEEICTKLMKETVKDENVKHKIMINKKGSVQTSHDKIENIIENSLCVEGDTYEFRKYLKNKGFKWNAISRSWNKPSLNNLNEKIRRIVNNEDLDIREMRKKIAKISYQYVQENNLKEKQKKQLINYIKNILNEFGI